MVAGLRLAKRTLWSLGLGFDLVGVLICVVAFSGTRPGDWWLLLNPWFLGGFALACALYFQGFVLRSGREERDAPERITGQVLYVIVTWGFLGLLSWEVFSYVQLLIAQKRSADWAAQASLTILWTLYAVGLLAVGFMRRLAWVRLSGLGLFAISACKLVGVDLAGV